MICNIPLDLIIDSKENIYKLATVAIKEAERLAADGEDEVEKKFENSKVTSIALTETFRKEVDYKDNSDVLLEKKKTL